MRTLLAWLSLAAVALAQTPTERKPNGDFENAYPRWAPSISPGARYDSGEQSLLDPVDGMSVAVDGRGVIHIAARMVDAIDPSKIDIVYMNSRDDSRRACGFSNPLVLDQTTDSSQDMARPDIWVHEDDSISVTWEYQNFIIIGNPFSEIRYAFKDASGWGGVQTLAHSGSQVAYMPQVAVDPLGRHHFFFVTTGPMGGSGTAHHHLLETANSQHLQGLSVDLPSLGTDRGNLRIAFVPGSPDEVRLVSQSNGVYWIARDNTGTWGSWTQFGQNNDRCPDVAYSSSGALYASCVRPASPADVIFFSDPNLSTEQTVFTDVAAIGARIITDSRDQVHLLTSDGSQLWYAAKVKNPNPSQLSANFYTQAPTVVPLGLSKPMLDPWEIAISRTDRIVVVDDDSVTWTTEYDLRPWSAAGALGACPGGDGPGGTGGPPGGGGGGDAPGVTTGGGSGCPSLPSQRGTPSLFPFINAINGNVSFDLPLFSTQGLDPVQSSSLHYNTHDLAMSLIAPGWRLNHDWRLFDSQSGVHGVGVDSILISIPGDRDIHFAWNATKGYLTAEDEYGFYAKIVRLGSDFTNFEYVLTLKSGLKLTFNNAGKVREIRELTGNFITFTYSANRLTSVTDQLGNGGAGRSSSIAYESTGNALLADRITRITDPALKRYDLGYTGHLLTTVKFFDGPSQPTWGFDYYDFGNPGPDGFRNALAEVRTPEGQAAGLQYGQSYLYYPDGRFKGLEDPLEVYLLDTEGDLVTPIARVASTSIAYEETGDPATAVRVTTHTNRRGFQAKFFNEPRRSLLTRREDACFLAAVPGIFPTLYAYDTSLPVNRNLVSMTDRWNFLSSYAYHAAPGGSLIPVQDNLFQVFRPKMAGAGQDKVLELTYTTDDLNRVDLLKTFATPTGLVSAPVTRTTDYTTNAFGQVTAILHPAVTRPDGTNQAASTLFTFGGVRKQLTVMTDEESHLTNFNAFDAVSWLPTNITRQGGTQPELFSYDVMGNLASQTRPTGGAGNEVPNATIFGRDGLHRVSSITDPAGEVTTFGYTRNSQLSLVDPPAGDNTTTEYDKREFVKGGSTPDGTWSQFVDANGNVSRVYGLRGNIANPKFGSNFDFEALDRMSESRVEGGTTLVSDGGGYNEVVIHNSVSYTGVHIAVYAHDGFDGGTLEHFTTATRLGAPANRVTKTIFNNRALAKSVLEPDLATLSEFFYDELGQEVARQLKYNAAFQTATLMFRDARDRVDRLRVQDTLYLVNPGTASNSYTLYNKANSVVRTVDPLGQVNPLLRPHTVEVVRDARERVTQIIDGKNVIVQEHIYGDDDLVTESRRPDPATKTTTLATHMKYTYTKRKELKTALNRNNVGMSYVYGDLPDQVTHATNAGGIVTRTTYDFGTQRVDTVFEADGTLDESRTSYDWTNGLLTSTTVWNPAALAYSSIYTRDHDKADRLERLGSPAVASGTQIAAERYFLNAFDETAQFVAGTKTITHGYNAIGQPTLSTWSGAYAVTVLRQFDEIGNLELIDDGTRKREMDFDRWINHPTAERFFLPGVGTPWKSQTHGFDLVSNYRTLADPEGGSHAWEVDENNRVTQIKFNGVLVSELFYTPGGLLDFSKVYDAVGVHIATTTETYDTLGRLAGRTTLKVAGGATLADFAWGYDIRDRRTSINLVHQALTFALEYDERDQLERENTAGNGTIGARDLNWLYDKAGNRLTQTNATTAVVTNYTYNAASQLKTEITPVQNKTRNYTYNQWANLTNTSTTIGAGPGPIAISSEKFGYNYLNLLSTYQPGPIPILPGGGSPPNGWQYDYWPTGERAAKTNLSANPDQSELYVTRFDDVVTEYTQSGAGAIIFTNRYVQGTGIDSKSTRITAGGTRRHYLGDGVGTVALTLDDTAAVAEQTIRDAWGNRLSAAASAERYGFAQREHDGESGLVHMRARQYDPRIGRFTQTDPIRFNVPSFHYTYALNSPASATDPFGLQPSSAAASGNSAPSMPGMTVCEPSLNPLDEDPGKFDHDEAKREEERVLRDFGDREGRKHDKPYDAGAAWAAYYNQFVPEVAFPAITIYFPPELPDPTWLESFFGVYDYFYASDGTIIITKKSWWAVAAESAATAVLGGFVLGPLGTGANFAGSGTRSAPRFGDAVRVSASRYGHIVDRHLLGIGRPASRFYDDVNILDLIRWARRARGTKQANGNFARVLDLGRNIGIDRATGRPTSIVTVITDAAGNVVTAFPGLP